MAYNLFDVIKDEILGRADHVSSDVYTYRVSTCLACDHLDTRFNVPRCKLCGCFIKSKAKYNKSECPDLRWSAIYEEE